MKLNRWNERTKTYEPYEIPDEWNVSIHCKDLDAPVNCPHCGKLLPWGETYTSKQFHTEMGFGYGVCGECYQREWAEARKLRDGA